MPQPPKDVLNQLDSNIQKIKNAHPELSKAWFGGVFPTVLKDGALSNKQKELIALALAVQSNNEFCICRHVKLCLGAGCTKEEMAEALGVSVLFGGGPSMSFASYAMEAIEELNG